MCGEGMLATHTKKNSEALDRDGAALDLSLIQQQQQEK